jgi:hypothetical protein
MHGRCRICGIDVDPGGLEKHVAAVHYEEVESSLYRKAEEEQKARRRTRGPYRKASAA